MDGGDASRSSMGRPPPVTKLSGSKPAVSGGGLQVQLEHHAGGHAVMAGGVDLAGQVADVVGTRDPGRKDSMSTEPHRRRTGAAWGREAFLMETACSCPTARIGAWCSRSTFRPTSSTARWTRATASSPMRSANFAAGRNRRRPGGLPGRGQGRRPVGGYRDGTTKRRGGPTPWSTCSPPPKGGGLTIAHAVSRGCWTTTPGSATTGRSSAQGKDTVTLRQLLAHQAGLCALTPNPTLRDVADPVRLAPILAAQKPAWRPGTARLSHRSRSAGTSRS